MPASQHWISNKHPTKAILRFPSAGSMVFLTRTTLTTLKDLAFRNGLSSPDFFQLPVTLTSFFSGTKPLKAVFTHMTCSWDGTRPYYVLVPLPRDLSMNF